MLRDSFGMISKHPSKEMLYSCLWLCFQNSIWFLSIPKEPLGLDISILVTWWILIFSKNFQLANVTRKDHWTMTVTISMDNVLAKMIILLGVNVIKLHLDIMTSLILNVSYKRSKYFFKILQFLIIFCIGFFSLWM